MDERRYDEHGRPITDAAWRIGDAPTTDREILAHLVTELRRRRDHRLPGRSRGAPCVVRRD